MYKQPGYVVPGVHARAPLPSRDLLQGPFEVGLEPRIDVAHPPAVLAPQLQVAREQLVDNEAQVGQEAGAAPEGGDEGGYKLGKGGGVDAVWHAALQDLSLAVRSMRYTHATHRGGLLGIGLRHVHDGRHGQRGGLASKVLAAPWELADEDDAHAHVQELRDAVQHGHQRRVLQVLGGVEHDVGRSVAGEQFGKVLEHVDVGCSHVCTVVGLFVGLFALVGLFLLGVMHTFVCETLHTLSWDTITRRICPCFLCSMQFM